MQPLILLILFSELARSFVDVAVSLLRVCVLLEYDNLLVLFFIVWLRKDEFALFRFANPEAHDPTTYQAYQVNKFLALFENIRYADLK